MCSSKEPKVAVIVPIFNAEPFLHRCVDSLVYQTLNDIEILLIDNQSEDRSWEIMKQYKKNFPDKVKIFQLEKHYDGPGAGRNLGLKHTNAPYIGFADADDYFEYNAFEMMYNKAVNEQCDLVYVSSYDVKDLSMVKTRNLPTGSREEILTIGSMVFWNKLIDRRLFDLAGDVPTDMVFEDLAYCTTLVSYAKNIGYIDSPLYYYIIREDSGVNTLDPARVLKSLEAEDIGLQNCNPEYLDYFADSVAMRLCNDIRDRWQFTDSYIQQLRKIRPLLEDNNYFKSDIRNYRRVNYYYSLAEEPMPTIIYLNNFGHDLTREFIDQIKESAFFEGADIVLLDSENYNLYELSTIQSKLGPTNTELIGQYFALKRIYEQGGIYIDSHIEIDMPLNSLRYYRSFFGYIDKENFTDKIWGAVPGSRVVKMLIDRLYQSHGEKTLADFIKEIYMVEMMQPLTGETDVSNLDMAVFEPVTFVYDTGRGRHMTCHNFKDKQCDNNYITLKRSSLKMSKE